jgi:hypothetical protein
MEYPKHRVWAAPYCREEVSLKASQLTLLMGSSLVYLIDITEVGPVDPS